MRRMTTMLRQQPIWIALIIVILLSLWVASGSLQANDTPVAKSTNIAPVPKVRVKHMVAEQVSREITLYGRTEPNRIATLRAEVKGQVLEIMVQEGQKVKQGQPILRLDSNDLKAQIQSAQAILKQREIELVGAKSLGQKGFQSQSALAQAQANVQMAMAELTRLNLALNKTQIVAPFEGVLNSRAVEIGDLLKDGDEIATVVDLDPLIISADVTENVIQQLNVGQQANAKLVSGQHTQGQIRYISSMSNIGTNTFKIEVEVPNSDGVLLAGMSTSLSIPLQQTWAMKITPAVMALDEQGNLGVKTVMQNIVHFVPIDILKSDSEGVWLAGLGEKADVITLGHGFVRDGDTVEVVLDDSQAGVR